MYSLVYAISMCELQKIFFLRDMMDIQCANIFSTHVMFMGHIMASLHLLKERIFFFMCIPNLIFFKFGVCLSFPHPLYFFPKLVLFFLFLQGEKLFFNLCGSQGELLLFIGGAVSIFYRIELFCVPLIFFFSYLLLCMFTL